MFSQKKWNKNKNKKERIPTDEVSKHHYEYGEHTVNKLT